MPFGPARTSFITCLTEMTEKTPKETSFVGSVDPNCEFMASFRLYGNANPNKNCNRFI